MNPAPTQHPRSTSAAAPSSDGVSLPPANSSALHYCLMLVLLPLLAIPALIALGRSDFFLHHGASVWVQSDDAVFAMHDRVCDVLVYGDSTAMTGIDPEVVERESGLRTCNIAVTNAVLAVTGNLTLDHFLAHNARPRVLLVQLSPDGFQPQSRAWHQTIFAEGLLELLRHGQPGEARLTLLAHPQEAIAFAGYAAGFSAFYGFKDLWFHATSLRTGEDTVTVRNGFFTPPAPPRTSCTPPASLVSPSEPSQIAFSRSLVTGYQSGYGDRAGTVLVNVAPIPACDGNLAAYASELNGITSNSLLSLPVGLFNDSRHYTAQGSEIVSTLIAQELNLVAPHPPAAYNPVPPNRLANVLRNVRFPPRSGR